ncbi:MAG: acetyl-CoA carboxylase biotin carboxyl carrier protein [Maricaulaceae bacterium]
MSQSADDAPKALTPLDTRLVRDLAEILQDTGLTEIEVEQGALHVRVARDPAPIYATAPAQAQPQAAPVAALSAPEPAPQGPPPETPAPSGAADARAHPGAEKSPMVGTAYHAAEPGAAPFVQPGDTVAEGQTVMIVEAMKTMNPIPAPRAGVVKEILVGDSRPVEYGEVLMILG